MHGIQNGEIMRMRVRSRSIPCFLKRTHLKIRFLFRFIHGKCVLHFGSLKHFKMRNRFLEHFKRLIISSWNAKLNDEIGRVNEPLAFFKSHTNSLVKGTFSHSVKFLSNEISVRVSIFFQT